MFFVVNKSKIYSYLIAVCMVVVLFAMATSANDTNLEQNVVETGTNTVTENTEENALKNALESNEI